MVVDEDVVFGGAFGRYQNVVGVLKTVDGRVGWLGPPAPVGHVGGHRETVLQHLAVGGGVEDELRFGHLGESDGEDGVAVVDGAEGVGEVVVGGGSRVGFAHGEAAPVVGVGEAEGVDRLFVGGSVDYETECHDGVAVGDGADGVDGAGDVVVVPLVVNPSHRVTGLLVVGGPVGGVDGEGEVDH